MIGSETKCIGAAPVASIFATPTLASLLVVFSRTPERRFYQKELVNLTGRSLYLVQRELKRLERVGLVRRTQRGRQVEYEANADHPAFPGIRDALLRTLAIAEPLRRALSANPSVQVAFVFGSVARGEDSRGSDVDILVVGDVGLRDVATALVPAVRELGREPNIMVLSRSELRRRLRDGDGFARTVVDEPKLWILGDDEQLAEVLG